MKKSGFDGDDNILTALRLHVSNIASQWYLSSTSGIPSENNTHPVKQRHAYNKSASAKVTPYL